jgi:hypothetical protein
MKSLIIFGIIISIATILGVIPIAEAHPHATIDEHVIISVFDWFNIILFG